MLALLENWMKVWNTFIPEYIFPKPLEREACVKATKACCEIGSPAASRFCHLDNIDFGQSQTKSITRARTH